MPKMPNKVPLLMCHRCRIRGAWIKSNKKLCYWCDQLEEASEQPVQETKSSTITKPFSKLGKATVDCNVDPQADGKDPRFNKQIAPKVVEAIRRKQKRGRLPKQGPW